MTIPYAGLLLVDKPVGLTSFDVIRRLKRVIGKHKIGHAGTLDPFASGLLIMAIGRQFTKRISEFVQMPKTYRVKLTFGMATDTLDSFGQVGAIEPGAPITQQNLEACLTLFLGEQDQMPPHFSAKKIKGQKAYELARKGEVPDLKPSKITIYDLVCESFSPGDFPTAVLKVKSSKGTYVRKLVEDIAQKLGTIGYAQALVREEIGEYSLRYALHVKDFSEEMIKKQLWQTCFGS